MKKVLALMLALVLVLSLAACGSGEKKKEPVTQEVVTEAPATEAPVTEAPLTDEELCAEYAVEKLKYIVSSPNDLIVNKLQAVKDDNNYIFKIDYTEKTLSGGSNYGIFYISVSKKSNGFAIKTYGSKEYYTNQNQEFTKQVYDQKTSSGYDDFDTTTYRLK